jgi:hypothetical protein
MWQMWKLQVGATNESIEVVPVALREFQNGRKWCEKTKRFLSQWDSIAIGTSEGVI